MQKLFVLFCLLALSSCAHNSAEKEASERRADLHYAHGTSKLVTKEYTEALDHLLKANQAKPKDTKILNNLGMAYYLKGEIELAEKHLLEAIRADGKNSDARNNLASLFYQQGRLDEAKQQYLIVQKDLVYMQQYRVKYNLALIHLRENNRPEAVRLLKAASLEREDYCAANHQLGILYKQVKQYEQAIEWMTKAGGSTCYGEVVPHFELGELYELTNKFELARLKYLDVQERFPRTRYAILSAQRLRNLEQAGAIARDLTPKKAEPAPTNTFNTPTF